MFRGDAHSDYRPHNEFRHTKLEKDEGRLTSQKARSESSRAVGQLFLEVVA
jgi:hypothetical protein